MSCNALDDVKYGRQQSLSRRLYLCDNVCWWSWRLEFKELFIFFMFYFEGDVLFFVQSRGNFTVEYSWSGRKTRNERFIRPRDTVPQWANEDCSETLGKLCWNAWKSKKILPTPICDVSFSWNSFGFSSCE